MIRVLIVLILISMMSTSMLSQKEDHNWIFNWSDGDFFPDESEWNGSVI